MLPFSDKMTFWERYYNAALTLFDRIVYQFQYLPLEEALAKKHFSHLEPLPSLYDLINNVSLVLVNTHRAISPPRPAMPGKNSKPFSVNLVINTLQF